MRDLYQDKLRTKQQIAEQIKPGDSIVLGSFSGEPHGCMRAFGQFASHITPIHISASFLTGGAEFLMRPGVKCFSGFLGPYERAARARFDNVVFTPVQFTAALGWLIGSDPPDYFIHRVTPPDERGHFNYSLTSSWEYRTHQWLRRHSPSTKIVVEVNPHLPRVFGLEEFGNNSVSIEEVDLIVEDDTPMLVFPTQPSTGIDQSIAAHVANLVEDRSTVQLGIGTLPMLIGHLLCDRKDLGVHTEMLCDAHLELIEAGSVTNAHKGLYNGRSIATFAIGGPKLWNWARENPELAMLPVEEVNAAKVLSQVNTMVSINSVLSIDLAGQACAHCLGPATYSGLGGAFEFAYGAQLSPGGKSILCLPSTVTLKDGSVVSNIAAVHPLGTRVTVPEHCVDWVVTEYGAVRLKYRYMESRAAALISIAHPNFRDDLARQAESNGLRLSKGAELERS